MTVKVLSSWALPLATQSLCLVSRKHKNTTLLERIPAAQDFQSAWTLLLYCAAAWANSWLRTTSPAHTGTFAQDHDRGISRCLCQLLHVDPDSVPLSAATAASLPRSLGGLDLRSAARGAAHWASWADSLKMVFDSHLNVAGRIVRTLKDHHPAPSIQAALICAVSLTREGFNPPPWEDLLLEEPEPSREKAEPGQPRKGWQKRATEPVEVRHLRRSVRPQLTNTEAALLRSQADPMASAALTAIPSQKEFRLAPQPFRILLLRRLRLHLPVPGCVAVPSTSLATTIAACWTAGVLGRRVWVLENVAARVCREVGGRVRVNVLVRDMDLHEFNQLDGRRLEVVVDGLPLWNGAQLAIDTTMVSPVRSDGTARAATASINGKALDVARARKARRYSELSGEHGKYRLVVLGTEVGG